MPIERQPRGYLREIVDFAGAACYDSSRSRMMRQIMFVNYRIENGFHGTDSGIRRDAGTPAVRRAACPGFAMI